MKLQDLLKDTYKEGMTAEEIIEALSKVEEPKDNSEEIDRLKAAVSKANSEAADYKKQLKASQTEEERAKAEKDEELENLKLELETLKRDKELAENKAQFVALGFDDKLADSSAKALLAQDYRTVFANHKAYLESYAKTIESKLLQDTPRPSGSVGEKGTITKEMFDQMEYSERVKVFEEQPQLYAQFTNNEK